MADIESAGFFFFLNRNRYSVVREGGLRKMFGKNIAEFKQSIASFFAFFLTYCDTGKAERRRSYIHLDW